MSRNQWHFGVHERHLMFKGPVQLNYNVVVFIQFSAMGMFLLAEWLELITLSSNVGHTSLVPRPPWDPLMLLLKGEMSAQLRSADPEAG